MPGRPSPPFSDHLDCQTLTGLTLEHLPRDRALGRDQRYDKGTTVWRPDDKADRVYLLRHGRVAVSTGDADGRELLLRTVEAEETFGEICLCAPPGGVRQTSARAMVQSAALEIMLADFLRYLQESPVALAALVCTLCARLTDAEQRFDVLAHRRAEHRLGRLLLRLAASRHVADESEGRRDVILTVSHDELALMAGISRPHVTVTMGQLRRKGLVRYDRGRPLRVDVTSLAAYLSALEAGDIRWPNARADDAPS